MRKATTAVLVILFLSTFVITTPVPASAPSAPASSVSQPPRPSHVPRSESSGDALAAPAVTSPLTGTVSVFLPMVTSGHISRPPCTTDSPFGLAIAAIHQVLPDGLLAQSLVEGGALLQALEESGACWAHVGIDWSVIQPEAPLEGQPPVYDWTWHDEKLALVAGTGVQLYTVVEFVPDWARGEPYPDLACTNVSADRLDEFAQFLTDMVTRYKEPPWNIHYWELRNEPDGTWPDRAEVGQGCGGLRGDLYAQMMAVAYPAIKAADPSATVLMGGVAHDWFIEYDGPFYRYFPDDIMANGAAAYLDATNFHYFRDFHAEWERWDPNSEDRQNGWLPAPTCGDLFDGLGLEYEAGGIDVIAKASHFRNRLATCFGVTKPVWLSELAEHGYPGNADSLEQQARYVIQGFVRGLAAGVQNITWFALVSPNDSSEQGLLYQDLTPKPAYYAYQTLTRELAGYEYSRSLTLPGVEGYVFYNDSGTEKTVAWAAGAVGQPAYVAFGAGTGLRVVDRWGNATRIQDGGTGDADGLVNGYITIQLPPPEQDPHSVTPALSADPLFISR